MKVKGQRSSTEGGGEGLSWRGKTRNRPLPLQKFGPTGRNGMSGNKGFVVIYFRGGGSSVCKGPPTSSTTYRTTYFSSSSAGAHSVPGRTSWTTSCSRTSERRATRSGSTLRETRDPVRLHPPETREPVRLHPPETRDPVRLHPLGDSRPGPTPPATRHPSDPEGPKVRKDGYEKGQDCDFHRQARSPRLSCP